MRSLKPYTSTVQVRKIDFSRTCLLVSLTPPRVCTTHPLIDWDSYREIPSSGLGWWILGCGLCPTCCEWPDIPLYTTTYTVHQPTPMPIVAKLAAILIRIITSTVLPVRRFHLPYIFLCFYASNTIDKIDYFEIIPDEILDIFQFQKINEQHSPVLNGMIFTTTIKFTLYYCFIGFSTDTPCIQTKKNAVN